MHIINLKMRDLRKLRELYIEPGVLNTEASMLVLKRKSFPDKVERVFKFLDLQIKYAEYMDDPDLFNKKIFTVTTLNNPNGYSDIEELVIPDSIVYVDGYMSGFAMPLIANHKNLGAIINNDEIPLKDKIPYLEQMGNIIDKVQRVESNYRMQFGDLNEFNFIIDEDDKVKAIDLDSAYLGVGEPLSMAYYLLKNKYIASIPDKYRSTSKGIIIPSDDTDLYCYNMILLNALAKENIYKKDITTYYQYLSYIKELGMPDELLESLGNIYIPKHNLNPRGSLEDIDTRLEKKLEYKTFQKEVQKKNLYS